MIKQAPKGKWRYGCVKRTYVTKLPNETFKETLYEIVEVYDQGKSWTGEAVTIYGSSKKDLIEALQRAIKDLETYMTIVEKKPIVHVVGEE